MKQILLPLITDKQLQILLLLYKFRFLNTNQIQKLLNHKNPQGIQLWLKELKEKEYIMYRDFDRKKFGNNTKPAIYSLTKLGRQRLKTEPKVEVEVLNRVYREQKVLLPFVNRYIFLADIYLNILSQLDPHEQLKFFTPANLYGFDYFPKPMPDAYISIKDKKKTKRYFLFLLKENAPTYQIEIWIKKYLEYIDYNDWNKYTKDPLPSFLIICKNEFIKRRVHNLIIDTSTEGKFYLATKDKIQQSEFSNVWKRVKNNL